MYDSNTTGFAGSAAGGARQSGVVVKKLKNRRHFEASQALDC